MLIHDPRPAEHPRPAERVHSGHPSQAPAPPARTALLLALVAPAIAATLAAYALLWSGAQWRPPALALVLVAAIVYSTLRESELRMAKLSVSGNLIPFFAAVELLGPLPAGLALALANLALNLRRNRSVGIVASNVLSDLLVALLTAGGLALLDALLGTHGGEPLHLVALIAAGFCADSLLYLLLVALTRIETGERPPEGLLRPYLGLARVVFIGMLMTAAVVWVHQEGGLAALAVALVALPIFYELVERINRIENELRVERDRNARYLAVAGSMFLVLDAGGRISLINQRGVELLGRPEGELLGEDWFALTAPAGEVEARRAEFDRSLRQRDASASATESILAPRGGQERVVTWNTTVLHDDHGQPTGMLVSSEDVTARRRAEARVAYLAYHDQLTGLANRAVFEQRLTRILAEADVAGTALALYFLDVDGFKSINDELGHAAGDELLRQIAARLREVVRGDDLIVRQGGDEFLLLSRVARDRLEAGVDTLGERVESVFRRPFELDGRALAISVSVGVAVYPDQAHDGETLVRRADDDMYRAKRRSARARSANREPGTAAA
ncbi:MAG TPA: GGDEF domain-containing protein [Thermoleophilaceae bacterium]|jgi:diguanylate cyclase (GGDEF)-like protein/PAS domain S-box-containing protein